MANIDFTNPYPELQPRAKVPVKYDGFEIGEAAVSPGGGYITIKLNGTVMASEMRAIMEADVSDFVSIKPRNN